MLKKFTRMESILLLIAGSLILFVAIRQLRSEKSEEANAKAALGIEGLVTHVKHELKKVDSIRIAHHENALFQLKTFELEVNFIAKQTGKESAEINYQVVTLG